MSDGFHIDLDADMQAKLDLMAREYVVEELLPKMVLKAKRIVPVDTHVLQESIHQEVDEKGGRLVASTDYAVYVEQGTRFMPAQPFLRPAVYTALEGL